MIARNYLRKPNFKFFKKKIMGKEIMELAPKSLWKHFYAFTQIPRPSKHEAKVVKYIEDFAKTHNLKYTIDKVGNIIVRKPASKGKENAPGVILQSHVDMVPQKNSDKEHNFETDPIETFMDGDWLKAKDTTLGADNGIGCAAMLAVLEADDIEHGPIEALFTINEEAGMEGAFGLEANILKGSILVNLDSEDEGELFVGCAGGLNLQAESSYRTTQPQKTKAFNLVISGLKGGHSGMDIILGRGNSNKVTGRILWSALSNFEIEIASISGGDLRNAIPREAKSLIVIDHLFENEFRSFIEQFEEIAKEELKHTEPNLSISLEEAEMPSEVISGADAQRLIGMLNAAPNGVERMSNDMPGVVETSLNLAIANIENGKAEFFYLIRSSVDSAKYALAEQVTSLHEVLGCDVEYSGDYPGWRPNTQSYALKICSDTYETLYSKKPGVLAIHAGLECGIIGGKYVGLDMISFGPTIRFPHSPDEKVNMPTVDKFYDYLKVVLSRL
jgi:dipeptidase D